MVNIPIESQYYDNTRLYDNDTFSFNPGVTFLVGCNGSGKTTLMHQIEHFYNSLDVSDSKTRAKYFPCQDSGRIIEHSFWIGDTQLGATLMSSSEGERMSIGLQTAFSWMWNQCKQENVETIFMMLDSLDSGIDIPTIQNIRNILFEVVDIVKKEYDIDLYILVSSNSYALIENQQCLVVKTGQTITFENWDNYVDFCKKSDKYKQERYSKFH